MRVTLLLFLLLLALGLAACGDDDDESSAETQVFEVEATDKGKETGLSAPSSVEAGAAEIRFANKGERPHSLQVVQVGDGHTPEEVLDAGGAWADGRKALPDWVRFTGGIGSTKPGGSGIAVVDLPPGEYLVVDITAGAPPPYAAFTVEGDDGEPLPEVPARIEAVDYDFSAEELEAGSHRVLFENAGEEPHHLVAAPAKPGTTEADLKKYLETGGGAPPFDESKSFETAILSGGESTVLDLRLESGEYAFACFISDRAGGPEHVAKGMATIVSVE